MTRHGGFSFFKGIFCDYLSSLPSQEFFFAWAQVNRNVNIHLFGDVSIPFLIHEGFPIPAAYVNHCSLPLLQILHQENDHPANNELKRLFPRDQLILSSV